MPGLMISYRKLVISALGVALLCSALPSSALTLGRARGAALIGQPLDLSIPVQFESEESDTALCFDADVFFGDVKLESTQVLVTNQPSAQATGALVRVVSGLRVNEPVVTVYVRAGCMNKASRRYVLLAEVATEAAPVQSWAGSSVIPVLATVTEPAPAAAAPARPTASAPRMDAAPQFAAKGANDSDKRPAAVKPKRVARTPKVAGSSVERPARLKLLPLDLAQERDPTLKSSPELPAATTDDLGKRAQAAATWRSLNTTVQDVMRSDAQLQALETDLKTQRSLTSKNGQLLKEISDRLADVESQKYANPLVYALAALLLLCGAALAYAWSRLKSLGDGKPWWRGNQHAGVDDDVEGFVATAQSLSSRQHADEINDAAPVATSPKTKPRDAELAEVDIDLNLGESVFAGMGSTHASTPAPLVLPKVHEQKAATSDNPPSVAGGLRSINMQEMLDVRQQADFFMALGQHDEAVGILVAHISESGLSNPLVYLDLLKALHTLSRKTEYDRYRSEFNDLFTGLVPDYEGFDKGGNGLDAYGDVTRRITTLWPSQAAIDFIELCLVRTPEIDPAKGFDLNAYRDLLTLHAVASRIATSTDSGPVPFSVSSIKETIDGALPSVPAVLSAESFRADATQPLQVPSLPSQDAPGLDLDLDLDLDVDLSLDVEVASPDDNMIEFDGADLLVPEPPKPTNG